VTNRPLHFQILSDAIENLLTDFALNARPGPAVLVAAEAREPLFEIVVDILVAAAYDFANT